MMMDLESEERRPLAQATVAVRGRTTGIGVLVAATWLVALPAAAMPVVAAATLPDGSAAVQVLTTCDTRGCFTFGPRQSFHRPNYQPLGRTGPGVESPGAARPPRFIFRPQAPRPLPQARLPAAPFVAGRSGGQGQRR